MLTIPSIAAEKVFARVNGRAKVGPRDVVYPDPEFIMIHDGVARGAKLELDALGGNTGWHKRWWQQRDVVWRLSLIS